MPRFHHCPRCGAPTEPALVEGRERDRCTACGRLHYDNAKPCAGALVVHEGKLLMVRRAIEPYLGCWDIPGGFMEADEHPADGARREVFEETGFEVAIGRLVGMYMDTYGPDPDPFSVVHSLNLFFEATLTGGAPTMSAESSDMRWFPLDALPPMEEVAFLNQRQALADWQKNFKS